MNIDGKYITKNAIVGYHWYTSTTLYRHYLCVDLINGKTIRLLEEDGVGNKYNQNLIKQILDFIKS